ncbi:MAG: PQQ-binding-like beta-propeller repeat protein [Candidatus Eremiobacteraeota bacterium]|nr:PQQ-binding-like beta-propeller repeat protein [Candidatus Eremiobacteraeota bacterium]
MNDDVTAYDLATGAVRWHTAGLVGRPRALPSDGATVLFATRTVAALDAVTGAVRWRVTAPHDASDPAPVQDAERVYLGTSADSGALVQVLAYDRATGQARWAVSVGPSWIYTTRVRGFTLSGGTLYSVVTQCTNPGCGTAVSWVIALDPASGSERWRLRVADGGPATLIVEPVVAAGGLLLAGEYIGNAAIAIDPVRRRVVWRTAFRVGYGGPADAPVDDSSGVVYVGSADTYVYALDRATGARRWETGIGGSVNALGRCGSGVVAQALGVYALRTSDGRLLGTAYDRGDERARSPVVSIGNRLVVGTAGGVAVLRCP